MLRQSPFQGHITAALDTARAIFVRTEQTGISSARINHFTGEEGRDGMGQEGGCVLLPHAFWLMFVAFPSGKVKSKTPETTEQTRRGG